jgi:hypothetical protein
MGLLARLLRKLKKRKKSETMAANTGQRCDTNSYTPAAVDSVTKNASSHPATPLSTAGKVLEAAVLYFRSQIILSTLVVIEKRIGRVSTAEGYLSQRQPRAPDTFVAV